MISLNSCRAAKLLIISASLGWALTDQQARAETPSDGQANSECELHIWPTAQYGGAHFHAGNFRFDGGGTAFDLVLTSKEKAGDKAQAGFGVERQFQVVAESVRASGRFPNYKIIGHDPLPPEKAARHTNLLDPSVGSGQRESASKSPCYAELHVAFITVYKTSLSKKLMSGFLVRRFPNNPALPASQTLFSKLKRGHEQTGLANFSFANENLTDQESAALSASFQTLIEQFLARKKLWH